MDIEKKELVWAGMGRILGSGEFVSEVIKHAEEKVKYPVSRRY
jgi:hypothetical protein